MSDLTSSDPAAARQRAETVRRIYRQLFGDGQLPELTDDEARHVEAALREIEDDDA